MSLANCLFGRDLPGEDMERWYLQGFVLCDTLRYGLRQSSGGPCGVLAATQGYLLGRLLFGVDLPTLSAAAVVPVAPRGDDLSAAETAPPEALADALAHALAFLVWQCRPDEGGPASLVTADVGALPLTPGVASPALRVVLAADFPALQGAVRAALPALATPSGVVLLVFSLLLTRGLAGVAADMDEPQPLVARFGHCSQELLNLCLTGRATSGIFDGEERIGGDGGGDVLVMRGVARRPLVGYLSHVEALRYGRVGDFLKEPLLPAWVVGSESHFSLVVGADVAVIQPSPSADAYRAFRKHDAADAGFIPADKLHAVVADLRLPIADDAPAMAALAARLDSTGAGIVVWSEFWHAVGPLVAAAAPTPSPPSDAGAAAMAPSAESAVSSGVRAAAASAAPASTPAPAHAPAPATAASLRTRLLAALEASPTGANGFVMLVALRDILAPLGLPLLLPARAAEWSTLESRLAAGQPLAEAIVFTDDLVATLEPALQEAASAAARTAATAPGPAAAVAGALSPAAGSKRPRSDSDYARDLAAQWDAEGTAAAGLATMTGVPAPAPAPAPAAFAMPLFDLSRFGVGAPPAAATPAPAAPAAGASASVAPAPAGPSAYAVHSVCRVFRLWHYNGLSDRGREPRMVALTLRQTESGVPPGPGGEAAFGAGASAADALALADHQEGLGIGGIEEQTAAAIALSRITAEHEAAGVPTSTAAGAGGGSGSSSSSALQSILRTKWPGVAMSFTGPAPSID